MSTTTFKQKNLDHPNPQLALSLGTINKKLLSATVQVYQELHQKVEAIYKWRSQTKFPIVSIVSWITYKKPSKAVKGLGLQVFEVSYQQHPSSLSLISNVPLFKLLYLLKQSLIGIQRLFNKFGSFLFNDQMVFIDSEGKCKVWVNRNIHQNSFFAKKQIQSEFIAHVYSVFEDKAVLTKQSKGFFQGIKKLKSFFGALKYLQNYVEHQKIKIPMRFINYIRKQTISPQKSRTPFNANMTMSKKPSFLNNYKSKDTSSIEKSSKDTESQKNNTKNKPTMKTSDDTAAQTMKYGSPVKNSRNMENLELQKGLPPKPTLWRSHKEKNPINIRPVRKMSIKEQIKTNDAKIYQVFTPQIKKNTVYNFDQQLSNSILFMDPIEQTKRSSSSESNKEQTLKRTNQLVVKNGWELKLNSLFDSNQYKKSQMRTDLNHQERKKSPVKLDLLDRCQVSMSQSFMHDNDE